jgi:hypothetical protein
MPLDFQEIIQSAEEAVRSVKDPALKAVAFGKIIDALVGGKPGVQATVKAKAHHRSSSIRATKKAGTSGYLQELVGEDYFRTQRSLVDVKQELANRGHHVPLTSLSGPMQSLCKRRVLRREPKRINGKKSTFVYSTW